jgi:hypothetical protein
MSGPAVEVVRFERLESRGGYLCTLCLGYGGREHAPATHWAIMRRPAALPGVEEIEQVPICEQHARDIAMLAEALAGRRSNS